MRFRELACAAAALSVASGAQAATISGTVTGADNKPVTGVFVQGENKAANRLVNVLDAKHHRDRAEDLFAGNGR